MVEVPNVWNNWATFSLTLGRVTEIPDSLLDLSHWIKTSSAFSGVSPSPKRKVNKKNSITYTTIQSPSRPFVVVLLAHSTLHKQDKHWHQVKTYVTLYMGMGEKEGPARPGMPICGYFLHPSFFLFRSMCFLKYLANYTPDIKLMYSFVTKMWTFWSSHGTERDRNKRILQKSSENLSQSPFWDIDYTYECTYILYKI